jgi:hypothetical protein
MRSVSIDLLVVRRFITAFVALPLALAGAPGCEQGSSDDEGEEKGEEPVNSCDEDSEDEDCKEEPVCGDGKCEDGETDACSDCAPEQPEAVCGNGACEEGETSACSDCAPPATDATLLVENDSSYTVYFVYLTPCSSPSWGSDLLGANVMSPGQSLEITQISEGCWDFRAEGADIYWETFGNYLVAGEYYTLPLTD